MINFIGLDIGYHSIKLAKVVWNENRPILSTVFSVPTPLNVYASNDDKELMLLANAIRLAFKESHCDTNKVVVALPEVSITSRLEIGFPKLEEERLNEAIIYEAKRYITYPIDEMQIDKIVVGNRTVDNEERLDIYWVAVTKSLIGRYLKILKMAGLEVLAVETELIASARSLSLLHDTSEQYNIIVDVGANGTDVAFVKGDTVLLSQALGTGSNALNTALEKNINLEPKVAEEYKRTYGLDTAQMQGKVAESLIPVIQILINEINRSILFFKSKLPEAIPNKIFLVGEGSLLIGLPELITSSIKIPTERFDPAKLILKTRQIHPSFVGLSHSVAIGLAMKK